jgi:serine O-acetyltransferase
LANVFLEDLRRVWGREASVRKRLRVFRNPGERAVAIYRFSSWLQKMPFLVRVVLHPLHLFLRRRMRVKWGIEINPFARIGGGFRIEHFGGVFIGDGARIGENCTVFHDVTFVEVYSGPRKGQPTLGNNVIIYPGAKLVGRITLGNNVSVGPNVVLYRDVPDDAIVQVAFPQVLRMAKSKTEPAVPLSSNH